MAATAVQRETDRLADRAKPAGQAAATVAAPGRPWQATLERCREVAKARAVIAVDGEGLPVAWIGLHDPTEASRISAHVAKSFDLLDRLKYVGRFAECLCVMYWPEGTWLTAVRVAPKVSTVVTIAVVGPYTLVQRDRRRLCNTFLRLLEETRIE